MAYSYSSMAQYKRCPAQYKFQRIDRLPTEPAGPAAERGTMLHAEIEKYLDDGLPLLSDSLVPIYPLLDKLRARTAMPEVKFKLDRAFNVVEEDHFFVGYIDILILDGGEAEVIDSKTGKVRDYSAQLEFYNTAVLSVYPEVQQVTGKAMFVDHKGKMGPSVVTTREDLVDMQMEIIETVEMIENDGVFAANPNEFCRYCSFGKGSGGPCRWG